MYRWITIPAFVLLLLIMLAAGLFYLSYTPPTHPGQQVSIDGLRSPVQVGRDDRGVVSILASSEEDALVGLGYVHALERSWLALLFRQTALGRTSEWFGEGTVDVDRFVRTLGLGRTARIAFEALPEEEKKLLEAYARGFNEALGTRSVRTTDELSMLEIEPEPWEAWHVLAVERLYAWTAVETPSDTLLAVAGPEAQAFFRDDARLRSWLHLHGFQNSLAWAVRDTSGVQLYQRQVYGDMAVVPYLETIIRRGGQAVLATTLPGTPFMISGRSGNHAWSILPYGRLALASSADAMKDARMDYDRIRVKDGSEQLVRIRRSGRALVFLPPPPPAGRPTPVPVDTTARDTTGADSALARPDTLATRPAISVPARQPWVLDWSGFSMISDVAAWRQVSSGAPSGFRLITGSGLLLGRQGQVTVLGAPVVSASLRNGVLVGNTPWAAFVATSLDSLLARRGATLNIQRLAGDTYSNWASRLVPGLVRLINSVRDREAIVSEALTYLRNWDYSYDRASIGASVFDSWAAAYQQDNGTLPTAADSSRNQQAIYTAFLKAVARLQHEHGADLRAWRWERVQQDTRRFPIWAEDSLLTGRAANLKRNRFAPVHSPGQGHPTTVYWGPGLISSAIPAPAMWESWIGTAGWDQLNARRQTIQLGSFLGRYRRSDDLPKPITIDASRHLPLLTTLVPATPAQ